MDPPAVILHSGEPSGRGTTRTRPLGLQMLSGRELLIHSASLRVDFAKFVELVSNQRNPRNEKDCVDKEERVLRTHQRDSYCEEARNARHYAEIAGTLAEDALPHWQAYEQKTKRTDKNRKEVIIKHANRLSGCYEPGSQRIEIAAAYLSANGTSPNGAAAAVRDNAVPAMVNPTAIPRAEGTAGVDRWGRYSER